MMELKKSFSKKVLKEILNELPEPSSVEVRLYPNGLSDLINTAVNIELKKLVPNARFKSLAFNNDNFIIVNCGKKDIIRMYHEISNNDLSEEYDYVIKAKKEYENNNIQELIFQSAEWHNNDYSIILDNYTLKIKYDGILEDVPEFLKNAYCIARKSSNSSEFILKLK